MKLPKVEQPTTRLSDVYAGMMAQALKMDIKSTRKILNV